ncbi:unnamed protein product [Anisakis simplex]|uniref:Uncharacterized protein n=1 Tax=Anisakis simplex TaxID=6269 RepID=A0A0M3KBK0_ANISI|nr:unnamed protein product [Anisakis simplex]
MYKVLNVERLPDIRQPQQHSAGAPNQQPVSLASLSMKSNDRKRPRDSITTTATTDKTTEKSGETKGNDEDGDEAVIG